MAESVMFEHPYLVAKKNQYTLIRDILAGEEWLRTVCRNQGGTRLGSYVPLPQTENDVNANAERYYSYVQRATLFNATERTMNGMVGQVFSKPATSDFPESLKFLEQDPSGNGVNLEQHVKKSLGEVVSLGRRGLLVDAPTLGRPLSKAEADSGEFRPVILSYNAEDILNWRTKQVNGKTYLTLVVLRERFWIEGEFSMDESFAYRELRLIDGVYMMRRWENSKSGENYNPGDWVVPTDASGNEFSEIPFFFIGIGDNDVDPDNPPMYSLASLNLAHFRNSADYEENVFMLGQATLWTAGMTETTLKENNGKIYLGCRGGISLPLQGQCGILQVSENGLVKEAMDQKESQMISLGAQLVTGTTVAKTATEARQDKVTEVSTLAAAARNTSEAYRRAFAACQKFMGTDDEIKFELSTDYDMARMTSQEILAIVATWQSKLLTTEEARNIFRRAGFATDSLENAISNGVAKDADEIVQKAASTDNRAKKQEDPSGVN